MVLYTQLFLLAICLLGAFFFAGSETGFVSWNPLKVSHRAGLGDPIARWALYLMNHKDRLLSAVLIGNNICVVGGTLAFLTIFQVFDSILPLDLSKIPSPESWILTPLIVLFGEMLPKSLFRTYPFRLTMKSIPILMVVYFITLPLTWLLTKLASLFRRGSLERGQSFMTKVREEMVLIAVEGSKRGTIFESADLFMNSALSLKDKTIKDIMVSSSEFCQNNPVHTVESTIGMVKRGIPETEEIIIYDLSGEIPEGSVALLDIALAGENETLHNYVKPLPHIESAASLLGSLKRMDEKAPRFFAVSDSGGVIGLLDRMVLFRTAFGGISPDFNPSLS